MKKTIKIILLFICIFIFIYSAYNIFCYFKQSVESENLNNELAEIAVSASEDLTEKEVIPISVDFSILKEKNQDIIGWLYSENTPINYPIVQTDNNSFYLTKTINKEYNRYGSIFMDYRNSADFSDDYSIIYGHNMKNDTMFGSITNYEEQSYYEEHKQMYLFTPNANYIIYLIAGYSIDESSSIYNLNSMFDLEKTNSTFESEFQIPENAKYIILSTCSYEYEEARFILIGFYKEI